MLETALAIPYWLELAATIAGAVFGALSAVRARYDIFGVCCIASSLAWRAASCATSCCKITASTHFRSRI